MNCMECGKEMDGLFFFAPIFRRTCQECYDMKKSKEAEKK